MCSDGSTTLRIHLSLVNLHLNWGQCWVLWLVPVIPTIQESDIGRITIWTSPGKKKKKNDLYKWDKNHLN
jgi:hypothetical protein